MTKLTSLAIAVLATVFATQAQAGYEFRMTAHGVVAQAPSQPASPVPTAALFYEAGMVPVNSWAADSAAANVSLNAARTVWTIGARPVANRGQSISFYNNASSTSGRVYAELVSTTNSAWVYAIGKADNLTHGIALDGPACNRPSGYNASCTSNSAGTWGNSRIGILVDYPAATVTIYRNGAAVFTSTGINTNQVFRILAVDRDVPTNTANRTISLFESPGTWQYAPANVAPFTQD